MLQRLIQMVHRRQRLRHLGSSDPDMLVLQELLEQIRRNPGSLDDDQLRQVLALSSAPNWDAPPQAIWLVEEIRRSAEWSLEHRSRPQALAARTAAHRSQQVSEAIN